MSMPKHGRIVRVGFLANVFEWYDFAVYAFLASVIGRLFFAEDDPQLALIKSFAVFFISYLARPLGSLVLGYLADRFGRAPMLRVSLLMMAIPTLLIGLLPTYHNIGFGAISLLVLFRLIQGFAAGGELPMSNAYIYEVAPEERRNFFGSFVAASSMLGVFAGSMVVTLMHLVFTPALIEAWAWRLPFLLSAPIALYIWQLRRQIDETPSFIAITETKTLIGYWRGLFSAKRQIVTVFLLNAFISVSFYLLFVWMPSYLQVFLHVAPKVAHVSNSVSLFVLILMTLVVGHLAKFEKRVRWILLSIVLMAICVYPLFLLLNAHAIAMLFVIQISFALMLSCIDGVIMATTSNLFSTDVRCGGVSIGFTFSTAIFGGLAPVLVSWLIWKTGSPVMPVLLVVVVSVLGLIAVMNLRRLIEKACVQ